MNKSKAIVAVQKVLFSARKKDLLREVIVGNYRNQKREHERHTTEKRPLHLTW